MDGVALPRARQLLVAQWRRQQHAATPHKVRLIRARVRKNGVVTTTLKRERGDCHLYAREWEVAFTTTIRVAHKDGPFVDIVFAVDQKLGSYAECIARLKDVILHENLDSAPIPGTYFRRRFIVQQKNGRDSLNLHVPSLVVHGASLCATNGSDRLPLPR